MNVTWVLDYPDGEEQGTFLALDMGGTNMRVCEIILGEEKGSFDIIQSKYRMPEELKTGTAEELWEYIADCLQQFLEYHHENENLSKLPLGFTFSYPATQDYIDHGVLQRWTKGFDIDGVEGQDVVPPLETVLSKRVRRMTGAIVFVANNRAGPAHQSCCLDQRHYGYPHRLQLY